MASETATLPFQTLGSPATSSGDIDFTATAMPTALQSIDSQSNQQSDIGSQESIQRELLKAAPSLNTGKESVWPKVLATLAALSGNFGPAMQLHEQERRTALNKQALPVITQITNLAKQNKHEESLAVANHLFATAGSRSPELGQFIGQLSNTISTAQQQLRSDEAEYKMMAAVMKDYKDKYGTEHPSNNYVEAYGARVKAKLPMTDAAKSGLRAWFQPHGQIYEGSYVANTPATGMTSSQPLPEAQRLGQFNEYVIQQLTGELQITPADLQNYMNAVRSGQQFLVNGVDLADPKTGKPQEVFGRLAVLQQKAAALTLGNKVPLDPTTTLEALKRHGVEATAMRQFSGQPGMAQLPASAQQQVQSQPNGSLRYNNQGIQPAIEDIQEGIYERRQREVEAGIKANLNLDPFAARKAGQIEVIIDKKSPNFLSTGQPMSYDDIKSTKDIRHIPTKVYEETVVPLWQAAQGLGAIDELFKNRKYSKDPIGRVATGLINFVNSYTGFYTESESLAKVNQAIANRVIEDITKVLSANDPAITELKAAATGGFADATAARRIARRLQQRAYEKLTPHIGKDNIPSLGFFGLSDTIGNTGVNYDELQLAPKGN